MRSIIPTAHNSDSPLLRQPITPTAQYSDGPFFRQCKIELNLVQCVQLFLQFLTFPMPGRSIIIALNGDVKPRIKAPFPFQNILSRPWSVKISLTDGTSCWIHLVKSWICGLFVLTYSQRTLISSKNWKEQQENTAMLLT
jgi:hypothetical protein